MIARTWHGVAHDHAADDYLEHLRSSTLPQLERLDGYRGAHVLRREDEEGTEFVVVTLWDSLESIRAFAGDDPERAVVPPEALRSLARHDERARHYTVVETTLPGPVSA